MGELYESRHTGTAVNEIACLSKFYNVGRPESSVIG